MKKIRRISPLTKLARKGNRGYPTGTVAYYGPDNLRASKVAVAIVNAPAETEGPLERFFSDNDCRTDPVVIGQIMAFLKQHNPRSVVVSDFIMGCPHEEGIDYPRGEACPQCPYWQGRNRFSGEIEN